KDFFAFNDDPVYGVSGSKLEPYYKSYSGQSLVGGSNVQIMPFPGAVENLHEYNPEAKLIITLRNPVDRAYSDYWMSRRMGRERSKTFEAALALETSRAERGSFYDRAEFTYLMHGYYYDQIKHIYQFFKPEDVCIGLFDDLKGDPEQFTRGILDFLGADVSELRIDFSKKINEARVPRSVALQRVIRSQNEFKRLYRRIVPSRLQVLANQALFSKLEERNLRPAKYQPMAPETRSRLVKHFQPHNEKLSELIARDLSHWR
ncbi:MAG: sulfotransferase domain-containing protein, partial [Rhodospirillales bacterium]|nr:sulfotransferase domain-containing protein [Rhodospirillales bacterium]